MVLDGLWLCTRCHAGIAALDANLRTPVYLYLPTYPVLRCAQYCALDEYYEVRTFEMLKNRSVESLRVEWEVLCSLTVMEYLVRDADATNNMRDAVVYNRLCRESFSVVHSDIS